MARASLLMFLLQVCVAAFVPYVLFAFGEWCWDPGGWEPMSRAMCAVMMFFLSALVAVLANAE